LSTDKKK